MLEPWHIVAEPVATRYLIRCARFRRRSATSVSYPGPVTRPGTSQEG
jgi:hypothetical protein